MKTCLIIGINSFTGPYVSEAFKKEGYDVVGTVLSTYSSVDSNVSFIYKMDMLNYCNVSNVIAKVKPDILIHLAGISFVVNKSVNQFYNAHIIGTRNILAALCKHNVTVEKIILPSSSQVYGISKNTAEDSLTAPINDYAVSKLAMEYMSKTWMDKLPIIITRPFNYIGIGQAKYFIIPKIISAFKNKSPVLHIGNTNFERDFSDVRFVAQCYKILAEKAKVGETYNIASGKSYSIQYLIKQLRQISGFTLKVFRDEKFVRKNEPNKIVGNNSKFMGLENAPKPVPIEETIRWIYENWS